MLINEYFCVKIFISIKYFFGGVVVLNHLLECTFKNRGYAEDFFETINTCPHSVPKDTDRLCMQLKDYHDSQDLIVLLPDFDMDGIMCGVLGFAGLAELGFNISLFIPDVRDGYGFDKKTINRLVSEYPNVKAILTADVGITCYEGIRYAKSLDIDVFVTDHHQPGGDIEANVCVDPVREDDETGYEGSCGASVLYQVLHYYADKYADNRLFALSQIERLRVFAGFGTVSDSMPVFYENRPLIRDAVAICRLVFSEGNQDFVNRLPGCDIYRRAFLGLFTIMRVFHDNGVNSLKNAASLHEDFIGFYVAPAFNAIKRMEGDLEMAYGVFFGANPLGSMSKIYELNQERKRLVAEKYAALEDVVQPWAPYIYITDAGAGLRGLLAQQVMNRTGDPAIVIGLGQDGSSYVGSGRCPSWFPFLELAGAYEDWYAAGHNPAFGIGFEDESKIDSLYYFLQDKIAEVKPETETSEFKPDFVISMFGDGDAGLDVGLLTSYLDELELCRPFGSGFPEPEALLRINTANAEFSIIGKDKSHLKIHLPKGIDVLCWNQAYLVEGRLQEVKPAVDDESHVRPYFVAMDLPAELDVIGRFSYNDFNGNLSVQFAGSISSDVE